MLIIMSFRIFRTCLSKAAPGLSTTVSASLDVHEWICFGVVFSIPAAQWRKIPIIGTQLPVGTCYLWERLSAEVHKVLCGERLPPWFIYIHRSMPAASSHDGAAKAV